MNLKYENNNNYIVYDDEGIVVVFDDNSEKDEFIKIIQKIEKCDAAIKEKETDKNKFLKYKKLSYNITFGGSILTSLTLLGSCFFGGFVPYGIVSLCVTAQSLIFFLYSEDQIERIEKYNGIENQKKVYLKTKLDALMTGNDEKLKDCEVHSSVILSEVDSTTLRKLGINLTCEPRYQTNKLFQK